MDENPSKLLATAGDDREHEEILIAWRSPAIIH